MRPEVAAARRHLLALGRAFRITGFMAHFVIWGAVLCQTDLFERGQIQPVDTSEVAQGLKAPRLKLAQCQAGSAGSASALPEPASGKLGL